MRTFCFSVAIDVDQDVTLDEAYDILSDAITVGIVGDKRVRRFDVLAEDEGE